MAPHGQAPWPTGVVVSCLVGVVACLVSGCTETSPSSAGPATGASSSNSAPSSPSIEESPAANEAPNSPPKPFEIGPNGVDIKTVSRGSNSLTVKLVTRFDATFKLRSRVPRKTSKCNADIVEGNAKVGMRRVFLVECPSNGMAGAKVSLVLTVEQETFTYEFEKTLT